MSQVLTLLLAAKKLIQHPRNWTKGAYARTSKEGASCSTIHVKATCFCSVGALMRAQKDLGMERDVMLKAQSLLIKALGGSVAAFNDRSTHPMVLDAFNKAITAATQKQL